MTLTELRYIVVLAQELHFGRAATLCHVSQPTLSVGVRKLEDELGVAIFERNKHALCLTPLGESIIQQALKVLSESARIRELADAGKNQLITPLRVGAIYTIGPYLFPHLVPTLHRLAPQMPLYIEENFTHVLRQKLRHGDLDAVILALPFDEMDVVTHSLYEEFFLVVMPYDHPLTEKKAIQHQDLKTMPLLLLGEGHCFRDQVLESCPFSPSASSDSDLSIESGSLETIRHMVASGLGISVLPASAISGAHYPKEVMAVRPFVQPMPKRTVALAWRATFTRPQAIDALLAAIEQSKPNTTVIP